MSVYDELLGPNGQNILEQLFPGLGVLPNCPESADVVDDYLLTGEIRVNLEDSVAETFTIHANWIQTRFSHIVSSLRNLGPNHHYVIRGERTPHFQLHHETTQFHFFVLANIANQIYVLD